MEWLQPQLNDITLNLSALYNNTVRTVFAITSADL